tara:strand:- start:427 stop:780 length:354 start_codon:yes stop_codon:yes gene_type:complete
MEEEDDFNEKKYTEKMDNMYQLFPNLKFCPLVEHYDILDDVLLKNKDGIIYYKHECFCCNPNRTDVELIYIKRNRHITYRDFYQECNDKWKYDMCNHLFLESIDVKNDTQIDIWFGS